MGQIVRWLALTIGTSMVCAGFVACESTVEPPVNDVGSTRGDIGGLAGDSGAPSCFGAEAGCNDLALCGPKNLLTNVALAAPAPTGGAIAPGVYSMTSFTVYTGTNGATGTPGNWFMETFQIPLPSGDAGVDAGATRDAAIDAPDDAAIDAPDDAAIDAGLADAGPVTTTYPWLNVSQSNSSAAPSNLSGTLVTTGTSLDYEYACANQGQKPVSGTYSATATTFTFFFTDNGTEAIVYTLMQ